MTPTSAFDDMANVIGNKLKNGGVLSDSQRKQLSTIASAIFENYKKEYQPIYDQASKQLTAAGIPKAFWTIPDLNTLSVQGGITDSSQNNTDTSKPSDTDVSSLKDAGFTDNGDGSYKSSAGVDFIFQDGGWVPKQVSVAPSDKTVNWLKENGVDINSLQSHHIEALNNNLG